MIAGTRVPVRSIAISYERYEGNLQRICEAYRLDLEAVQDALAYYTSHREEIDGYICENERIAMSADPD